MPSFKATPLKKAAPFPNPVVLEERILTRADPEQNANRYFTLKLERSSNGEWRCHTINGRLGVVNGENEYGRGSENTARSAFAEKIREKEGKNYRAPRLIDPSSTTVREVQHQGTSLVLAQSGPRVPQRIVVGSEAFRAGVRAPGEWLAGPQRFYNELLRQTRCLVDAATQILSVSQRGIETPLGFLDEEGLNEALLILQQIRTSIRNQDRYETNRLNGIFFSTVPTRVGQSLKDAAMWTMDDVTRKEQVIQGMKDLLASQSLVSGNPQQPSSHAPFRIEPAETAEIQEIERMIREVRCAKRSATHDGCQCNETGAIRPKEVWRVRREEDHRRFAAELGNVRLLFHGTKTSTAAGIISRGLLCSSSANQSGGVGTATNFGDGIYGADSAGKALGYTDRSRGNRILFVVAFALGRMSSFEDGADYKRAPRQPNGCPRNADSTHGKTGSVLLHDEFIVYDPRQTALRYVLQL